MDEQERQRHLALPEQSEADKVGAIVEVAHLSRGACLQGWGGHPGPQEIPAIWLPASQVVPHLQQDVQLIPLAVCVLRVEDGGCAVCGAGGGGHVGEGSGWEQLIVIPFILSLVSVGESAGSSGAIWSKTTLKVFL